MEEVCVQTWGDRQIVGARQRKELEQEAKDVDHDQRQPEIRNGRQKRQGGRQRGVEPGATPPSGKYAQEGAHHKADYRRDADQHQRPWQALADDCRHGRGKVGDRHPEVRVGEVAEVRGVLLPDALMRVRPEHDAQRLNRLGIQPALEPGHQQQDRVAWHQTRNQEIERKRGPEGNEVEAHTAEEMAHVDASCC